MEPKEGLGWALLELQPLAAWCQKYREGEAPLIAPATGNRPQMQSEVVPKIYAPGCLSLCYL